MATLVSRVPQVRPMAGNQPSGYAPLGLHIAVVTRRPLRAVPGSDAGRRGGPFLDEYVGGDGSFHQAAEAFAGVLIHDGHDLDSAAVGGGVELEVHRPHLLGASALSNPAYGSASLHKA